MKKRENKGFNQLLIFKNIDFVQYEKNGRRSFSKKKIEMMISLTAPNPLEF